MKLASFEDVTSVGLSYRHVCAMYMSLVYTNNALDATKLLAIEPMRYKRTLVHVVANAGAERSASCRGQAAVCAELPAGARAADYAWCFNAAHGAALRSAAAVCV
jgi:hypothetical protein